MKANIIGFVIKAFTNEPLTNNSMLMRAFEQKRKTPIYSSNLKFFPSNPMGLDYPQLFQTKNLIINSFKCSKAQKTRYNSSTS